jgi:hypothetical protein
MEGKAVGAGRVQPARKLIQKQSDLLAVAKGRLVALRALGFGTKVFRRRDGEDETARLVELAAVDLERPEAELLAVLDVSWRRI